MLNLSKVQEALESKAAFIDIMREQNGTAFTNYLKAFEKLLALEPRIFNAQIQDCPEKFAGVLATDELKAGIKHFCLNKPLCSSEEASDWKKEILENRITFAVDGSQIEPDKNWGLVFGAVQIGWFINFHNASQNAQKDLAIELIFPTSDTIDLRQEINFKRFEKEIYTLANLIKQISKLEYTKLPIAFFDGSLTLSFVKDEKLKQKYLQAVNFLLQTSEQAQIPVVGYIDTSLAFNLTKSLETAFEMDKQIGNITDSALMAHFLKAWGERSAFFEYLEQSNIGLCYLKNSSFKNKPSRIELPLWVYKQGLVDEVLNVVLAECLVGNGFPYPIEVADSIAVNQHAEKEKFYEFIEKKISLQIGKSAKLKSKSIRRKPTIVI